MLMVISPAKTLDFQAAAPVSEFTQPDCIDDSALLIQALRQLSAGDIGKLMKVSDAIAQLNEQRFQDWSLPFNPQNAKQALFAFKGDVYTGMAAETFTTADVIFAQQHLRILSGLYGLLRPLDLMQAYRLEMGTGFVNPRGKNLYEFWGDKITQLLNAQLLYVKSSQLINLASSEYFSAVKPKTLQGEIITPIFKDEKNGEYKIISFFAKKARGMMAAFAIQERITKAEDLKAFNRQGYRYSAEYSKGNDWVFIRDEQDH